MIIIIIIIIIKKENIIFQTSTVFKEMYEKSTYHNCSNALHSDFFYLFKQKPRSQQGRLRTGECCKFKLIGLLFLLLRYLFTGNTLDIGANLIVSYWAPAAVSV